jgi:hypothetical protein
MSSLLERLAQHEAAARGRVEALRAELADLTERPAAEQERLSRLEITRTTVLELLASSDADQAPPPPAGAAGMQVPAFGQGGDGAGRRLPTAYQDVVDVLLDAGVPLRAMQVCQALGLGDQDRHREGMRSKLKRLVARGWLVEAEPGLFAPAGGVAGALGALNGRRGADRRG